MHTFTIIFRLSNITALQQIYLDLHGTYRIENDRNLQYNHGILIVKYLLWRGRTAPLVLIHSRAPGVGVLVRVCIHGEPRVAMMPPLSSRQSWHYDDSQFSVLWLIRSHGIQVQFIDASHQNEVPLFFFMEWITRFLWWIYHFSISLTLAV